MGALCGTSHAAGAGDDGKPVASPSSPSPRAAPRILRLNTLVDNRLAVADQDALLWINSLVATLWPRISRAVETLVSEQVEPQVREKLPSLLRSTFSMAVQMGGSQPSLGPISVFKNTHPVLDDGPKMMVTVRYRPDINISLKLGLLSAGVKIKHFSAACMVSLNPVTERMPVVEGLSIYFPDVPRFDLDFTGIANIADAPGISRLVRSALEGTIASQIVLPRKQTLQWSGEGGLEGGGATVADMLPIGMIRVKVTKCTGLPDCADWTIVGKLKIEPYVRLRLGDHIFDCNIGEDGLPLDPKEAEVEFAVFDTVQSLCISVYDADNFTSDDHIALHEPLKVIDALKAARSPLQLTKPSDEQRGAGTLDLEVQWLMAVNSLQDSQGCIVTVLMREVFLPAEWGVSENPTIHVKLGEQEQVSNGVLRKEGHKEKAAVDRVLADVRKRLRDHGVSEQTLQHAMQREEETSATICAINRDVWFKAEKLEPNGVLSLRMVAKSGQEIATCSVSFNDMKGAKDLHHPGPLWFTHKTSKERAMAEIEVRLCGLLLEELGT